jgi:hypothetical protein
MQTAEYFSSRTPGQKRGKGFEENRSNEVCGPVPLKSSFYLEAAQQTLEEDRVLPISRLIAAGYSITEQALTHG